MRPEASPALDNASGRRPVSTRARGTPPSARARSTGRTSRPPRTTRPGRDAPSAPASSARRSRAAAGAASVGGFDPDPSPGLTTRAQLPVPGLLLGQQRVEPDSASPSLRRRLRPAWITGQLSGLGRHLGNLAQPPEPSVHRPRLAQPETTLRSLFLYRRLVTTRSEHEKGPCRTEAVVQVSKSERGNYSRTTHYKSWSEYK